MKATGFGCWVGWDDDKQGGEWEAWADGGKKHWSGAFRLDPNQNWEWFAVTIGGGDAVEQCDAGGLKEAIRHLANPLPPEPEPATEPAPIDWDRVEIDAYRRYCRLWR